MRWECGYGRTCRLLMNVQLKHVRLNVLGVTVTVVLSSTLFVTLTGGNLLSIWLEPLTVEGSENRKHFWRCFFTSGEAEAWQLPTTCGDRTDLRHVHGLHRTHISSICSMGSVEHTHNQHILVIFEGPQSMTKRELCCMLSPSVLDSVEAGSIRIHCFVALLPRVDEKRSLTLVAFGDHLWTKDWKHQ